MEIELKRHIERTASRDSFISILKYDINEQEQCISGILFFYLVKSVSKQKDSFPCDTDQ